MKDIDTQVKEMLDQWKRNSDEGDYRNDCQATAALHVKIVELVRANKLDILRTFSPVPILRELEQTRLSNLDREQPSDWTFRVCQSVVSKAAGYRSRADWRGIIGDLGGACEKG